MVSSGAKLITSCFNLLILIFFVVFFTFSPSASAQLQKTGVTVTPVTDEFTAEPGTVLSRKVRVINPSPEVITVFPRVLNFHTDNEAGQPVFYSLNERSSRYAISEWVSFSKPFLRVAPNEEEIFETIINVPANAEPGGHYGAILFSTEEPKLETDLTQIGVIGMVGTLLLANVPGETIQKMTLTYFEAPRLVIRPPANFSVAFQNSGNVHLKPQGELKIRNWSGSASAVLDVNEAGGNILPESKRRFENIWQFDWKTIGRFTATAAITYGSPEQQLTASRTFYVIPLWFLIVFGALIALIIWLFFRRRRPRKIYTNSLPPTVKPPRIVMR